MTRYWLHRLARHTWLASAAVLICWAISHGLVDPDVRHRLSMASAYAALVYLAASLLVGPYRVWRKLPNPISFDLRRDIGIWAALLAILHTGIGLTVHLRGRMWMYFVETIHPFRVQASLFGFANYTGAAAAFLFLLLLLISNDMSLRTFGATRWKAIQRWGYVAAFFSVAHAVGYQAVEKRQIGWIIILACITSVTLVLQLGGFALIRRNRSLRLQRQHD